MERIFRRGSISTRVSWAVAEKSSKALAEEIVGCIESRGLYLSRLRGQVYDGVANMSGVYSSVQARMKEIKPLAICVHCTAHNFNFALNDSCNGVPDIVNFYENL